MSFWKKLFGGSDEGAEAQPAAAAGRGRAIEHKGFTIEAAPFKEAGQFQTAGVIRKEVGGVTREHRFIRADRFADMDQATEVALAKGRQIVDEQGEHVFSADKG